MLNEIPVGKASPGYRKSIKIEIFAFSSCQEIEFLEFELRANQGVDVVGPIIKMEFKMV